MPRLPRVSTLTSVKIDRTVFNPSRILKAYGSIARKGESTEDRPHRAARLLNIPDVIPECLGMDILQKIAGGPQSSKERKYQGQRTVNIEASVALMEQFLTEGGVKHGPRVEYKDGVKWLLETCPFNPEHVAPSIIVRLPRPARWDSNALTILVLTRVGGLPKIRRDKDWSCFCIQCHGAAVRRNIAVARRFDCR